DGGVSGESPPRRRRGGDVVPPDREAVDGRQGQGGTLVRAGLRTRGPAHACASRRGSRRSFHARRVAPVRRSPKCVAHPAPRGWHSPSACLSVCPPADATKPPPRTTADYPEINSAAERFGMRPDARPSNAIAGGWF